MLRTITYNVSRDSCSLADDNIPPSDALLYLPLSTGILTAFVPQYWWQTDAGIAAPS